MKERYVIIGCGPAGIAASEILRKNDPLAEITIISKEPVPCYKKHKLISYITGEINRDALLVKPYNFYKEQNFRLRLNQKVISIDPGEKKLLLKHMEEISYTKLLIATGTKAVIPEYLDSSKGNICFFHTILQSIVLKRKLDNNLNLGLICGDLIAYKSLKFLLKNNYKITLFLSNFWPLKLSDEEKSEAARNLNAEKNLEVVSDRVRKVERASDKKYKVLTENGSEKTVDLLVGSFEMKPELDFVLSSGIEFEKGILVNENLKSNIDDIWVAGDCAQIYNPATNDYWLSLGWKNAIISGEAAANNMLGIKTPAKIGGNAMFEIEGKKFNTNFWEELNDE